MNEIVSHFSVLQPATLQNINDADLLKKALEFLDAFKKDISKSFAWEILSFRSIFREEIEKALCIKKIAD